MNINQVFTILQSVSNSHIAKLIVNKYKHLSILRTLYFAYLLKHDMPVSKIIHSKWFYGLEFYTNKYTLDPRPDTETLVSAVIQDCLDDNNRTVCDLGTGTGCIICSLCKNINNLTGIAIDKSKQALKVAKYNVNKLSLNNKISLQYATFANFSPNVQFDIIVSNPPYIKKNDKNVNKAAQHDPKIALYAKNDGLLFYEQIAQNALKYIKSGGKIYLEIGIGQANNVIKIFTYFGWKFDRAEKDLSGINRVIVFTI